MESILQTWEGSTKNEGRCTATISRTGDLINRMYLDITGDVQHSSSNEGDNPGSSWIKFIELEIGGQRINRHSGLWMETWAELIMPN